jgi:rubrerythrin
VAKFACKCGYVINLIASPGGDEWRLIPEKTLEDIVDLLDGGEAVDGERFYETLRGKEITVYRCPSCGRLHLEEAGRNKFVTYVKECGEL